MEYYIGVISKIVDPDLYKIEVEIPEENLELQAFPKRGEIDEPRVGDVVILQELDPIYHSYYLYEKLKENNFIGIRSRGKLMKITAEDITIGIFDPADEAWFDANDGVDQTPVPTTWIKIDSEGNIDINAETNATIKIAGDTNIELTGNLTSKVGGDASIEISGGLTSKISGDANIEVSGNTSIKSSGNATIESPKVQITGGQLTVDGSAAPSGSGPFCGIPVCPFSGAPHIGNMVSGT